MRVGLAHLIAIVLFCSAATTPQQKKTTPPKRTAAHKKAPPKKVEPALPCGDLLGFQILLDRQGFSPGEIDGKQGANFTHALSAMQTTRNITATGQPDCDSWHALGGDKAGELLAEYTLTDEDRKGPFEPKIPREMDQQAKLTALAYQTPLERLGEKFHVAPSVLQRLNAGVKLEPGASIRVPGVQPFDASTKPAPDPAAGDVTVVVSREDSALRATRPDGSLVFFAPVTTGSEHDPLPTGDWKVKGVQWHPKFHYNPKLFWDAKPNDTRATIPAGPNNPVGVVWIDLDLPHYGLHGTPEPGRVGYAASHGCVRLTNWDAARVASLVKPGTPVRFE